MTDQLGNGLFSSCLVQGALATFARTGGLFLSVTRTAGEAAGSYDVACQAISVLEHDVEARAHVDSPNAIAANAFVVNEDLIRVRTSSCGVLVDADFFLRAIRTHVVNGTESYAPTAVVDAACA
jgi:hypothetical protein